MPTVLVRHSGDVAIVIIRRHVVAASRKRRDVLAYDESAADKILEAGHTFFKARRKIPDEHIVLVNLHAIDTNLAYVGELARGRIPETGE